MIYGGTNGRRVHIFGGPAHDSAWRVEHLDPLGGQWNAFPRGRAYYSDILGVIRDTGFVGIRISQVRETVDQRVGGDNPASPTRTWTRRNT